MVARQRGYTLIEVACALAVITILVTAVLVGESAQLQGVGRSYDKLRHSRAAASQLEWLRQPGRDLYLGETRFNIDGQTGTQRVRIREPGLFEVTVRVEDVELTTLIAKEVER